MARSLNGSHGRRRGKRAQIGNKETAAAPKSWYAGRTNTGSGGVISRYFAASRAASEVLSSLRYEEISSLSSATERGGSMTPRAEAMRDISRT